MGRFGYRFFGTPAAAGWMFWMGVTDANRDVMSDATGRCMRDMMSPAQAFGLGFWDSIRSMPGSDMAG